jgi:hypothetical protein
VSSAGALVIALAIDPDAAERSATEPGPLGPGQAQPDEGDATARFDPPAEAAAPVQPAPGIEPRAADGARPAILPASGVESTPGQAVSGAALVEGVVDSGTLPGAGLGVAASGGLRISELWLFAGGLFLPPRRAEVAGYPGKGGSIALVAGNVSACWVPGAAPFAVGLCGSAEGGVLPASGVGIVRPRSDTEPWLAGGASVGAWWSPLRSPLLISGRVGALVPLGRPEFAFLAEDGARVTAHQPSKVAFRLVIGAGLEFR